MRLSSDKGVHRYMRGCVVFSILAIALVWFAWPISEKWIKTISADIIGIDDYNGLLYTLEEDTNQDYIVRGYNLRSGDQQVQYQLPNYLQATAAPVELHIPPTCLLSPNKSTMAFCRRGRGEVHILSLGQVIFRSVLLVPNLESGNGIIDSFGFSRNGRLLAARLQKRIVVWDVATTTVIHDFTIPSSSLLAIIGNVSCNAGGIDISADQRYLATDGECGVGYLVDLQGKSEIVELQGCNTPYFLSDGYTLLCLPAYLTYEHAWTRLRLDNGIWQTVLNDLHFPITEKGMACCVIGNDVIIYTLIDQTKLASSMPEWLRVAFQKISPFCRNGVSISRLNMDYGTLLYRHEISADIRRVAMSDDGTLLGFCGNSQISLWEYPPRRSLTFCLCCGMLGTLLVIFTVLGIISKSCHLKCSKSLSKN